MMANGEAEVLPIAEILSNKSVENEDLMVPWDVDYAPMAQAVAPGTSSKRMARRWTFTLSSALGTDTTKQESTLEDLEESNEGDYIRGTSPAACSSRRVSASEVEQPGQERTLMDTRRCPYCNRPFAPRSYDRHVLLCADKTPSPSSVPKMFNQEAKERLEARIKYRPEKRAIKRTVKEKYQKPSKEKAIVPPSSTKSSSSLSVRRTATCPPKITKTTNKVAVSPNINIKSKGTSNNISNDSAYNPFIIAERQLMELLECTDYTSPSKKTTNKPAQLKPKSPLPNKPSTTSTPKQKTSLQTDLNSAVTKDEIDFEALENFINDNFDNDEMMHKLDLDAISLDSCSIKTETTSYFDDVSIDPRLINDFDNLSLPEHFDTQATTTPDMASQYLFTNCIRLEPLGHSGHLENIDVTNPVVMPKDQSDKDKVPLPKMDEASLKTDTKIFEEFTLFDKNYIIKRDSINDGVGPGDSAYGSLNRAPKIRSKVAPLTPLGTTMLKEEDSANSDGDAELWAKFCHQCGKAYPIHMARFCVWCGAQRLCLE